MTHAKKCQCVNCLVKLGLWPSFPDPSYPGRRWAFPKCRGAECLWAKKPRPGIHWTWNGMMCTGCYEGATQENETVKVL